MTMTKQFWHAIILSIIILFSSCGKSEQKKGEENEQVVSHSTVDCDQLPKSYSNYDEAVNKIKAAHFKIQETANTSKSSWIRGASYYSCDGRSGFFILQTDSQEYIYFGVPVDIWNGFKNAKSFGSYYDNNIKHKFSFKLNP